MKLLLVEDEQDLQESICRFLRSAGMVCETASDFTSALEKISLYNYDILLLDVTLPGGNGLALLDELKKHNPATGVIVISARDSLDDRLKGLELGADDYLTKPFHLAELNARIHAVLRRRTQQGAMFIEFNELRIDPAARQAWVSQKPLDLTRKEFDLLWYLLINRQRVLTREAIAEHLWGDHSDLADNFDFLYTHIRNLRRKIEKEGGPDYIQTVYGTGYKLAAL